MARYSVDIQAQLKGFTEIESKLKKLSSTPIDVKVNLVGVSGDLSSQLSGLQKSMQSAGESAGKAFTSGLTSSATGTRSQYARMQAQIANEIKKTSKSMQPVIADTLNSASESEIQRVAQKSATKYVNATVKANDVAQKKIDDAMSKANERTLANFQKNLQNYYTANTKMHQKYGSQVQDILEKSMSPDLTKSGLKELQTEYAKLQRNVVAEGLTGKSWFSEAKRAASQIGQFAITYGGIQEGLQLISNSVGELKEIDSILTEISKTSDLTDAQIKQLGVDAFDAASRWGQSASDYLTGIQEMSRSGYYGEAAEQMADLSVLAQAAGDLDADMANSYLLASNAAYQYQGNVEKLNSLLDGQNMITNRNSVSMQDMAEATTQAASMASELQVSEQSLSAMIGTIEARTKAGGAEVGNAIKSLLINVTNLNNSKITDTFEKAGVAQTEFINGVEQMRNPIDILEDLSKVFNSLAESDPLRNEILMNIGQKYQANKLSALLSGWSDYEKMLQDFSEGTGSAAVEAEKSANNWEGSLNKLSNSFTGLVQNFANSDAIISTINLFNDLVKGIDSVTSAIGPLSSLLGGLGLVQGVKGGGWNLKICQEFT